MPNKYIIPLIEKYCLSDDLECFDPYDVWMTGFGISIKELYNKNKILGILPAGLLTIWDQFINNKSRLFYTKQEYPTVRATAALTLLTIYYKTNNDIYLASAKKHIDWLIEHSCKGYSGLCWGLGFKWAAGDDLDYNENTPFSTHTPYVLEAIHKYVMITGDQNYVVHLKSIFEFYENDIEVMNEDEETLATSYGPDKDRIVTNAVSYTLYAYSIFVGYFPEKEEIIKKKIQKLYNFIKQKQLPNGSWMYSPDDSNSFIDCFHSCFVLKNIYKANQLVALPNCNEVLEVGYDYVKKNFFDPKYKMFKRFTISNKPSIVKFDLYDNAEVLHLAILLGDWKTAKNLNKVLQEKVVVGKDIYSVIDIFNSRRNKNTLRWAAMPYLYALSAFKKFDAENISIGQD
jgi:hypothetical protein